MSDATSHPRQDGRQLLQRAAAGDRPSWDALVSRYLSLTWALARGHGLDLSDAAEVVSLAWSRLGHQLRSGQPRDSPIGWLAGDIRDECSRRSTRQVHEPSPLSSRIEGGPSDPSPDGTPDPTLSEASTLLLALQQLPPGQRLVLRVLSSSPRPSLSDIAQVLGIPADDVARTAQQALARLREQLAADATARAGTPDMTDSQPRRQHAPTPGPRSSSGLSPLEPGIYPTGAPSAPGVTRGAT